MEQHNMMSGNTQESLGKNPRFFYLLVLQCCCHQSATKVPPASPSRSPAGVGSGTVLGMDGQVDLQDPDGLQHRAWPCRGENRMFRNSEEWKIPRAQAGRERRWDPRTIRAGLLRAGLLAHRLPEAALLPGAAAGEREVGDVLGFALDVGEGGGGAGIGAAEALRPVRSLWPLGVGDGFPSDAPGFGFDICHWQEGGLALVCGRTGEKVVLRDRERLGALGSPCPHITS